MFNCRFIKASITTVFTNTLYDWIVKAVFEIKGFGVFVQHKYGNNMWINRFGKRELKRKL